MEGDRGGGGSWSEPKICQDAGESEQVWLFYGNSITQTGALYLIAWKEIKFKKLHLQKSFTKNFYTTENIKRKLNKLLNKTQ